MLLFVLVSCSDSIHISRELDLMPEIFPDYKNVIIPPNIAPLNFMLPVPPKAARAYFSAGSTEIEVKQKKGQFRIPFSDWRKLLKSATGYSIKVKIVTREGGIWIGYKPFFLSVAKERIDPYLAYRLIDPGYVLWKQMGIYQRNLENFTEDAIIENKMSGDNCVNCHSFCMQDPSTMLFHMRETYPCTLLMADGKVEKLNTKTDQTISSLVYSSWHPSGNYVAFSVNKTQQSFHMNDRNRIEVFDEASDVVVYDVKKHEIVTCPQLFSDSSFETFPTFSPDGKRLYFCSADSLPMPEEYKSVRYNLCSIAFDPSARSFGSDVDTLFNADQQTKSASFPRISPDGKYLSYTLSGYGNFSIWHKDADLYMLNLSSRTSSPLAEANSNDVESYHSWSNNSRWLVFSSRRIDGLYTRPYIAYINKEGKAGKPFLLPQKDPSFYARFMKSYNIPEFIKGKVRKNGYSLGITAKKEKGIDISFSK